MKKDVDNWIKYYLPDYYKKRQQGKRNEVWEELVREICKLEKIYKEEGKGKK